MNQQCSFCTLPKNRVRILIASERSDFVCDGCIELCNEILSEEGIPSTEIPNIEIPIKESFVSRTHYYCSFCNKEQKQVLRLIASGRNVFICNECVVICNGTLQEQIENWNPKSVSIRTYLLSITLRALRIRAKQCELFNK